MSCVNLKVLACPPICPSGIPTTVMPGNPDVIAKELEKYRSVRCAYSRKIFPESGIGSSVRNSPDAERLTAIGRKSHEQIAKDIFRIEPAVMKIYPNITC